MYLNPHGVPACTPCRWMPVHPLVLPTAHVGWRPRPRPRPHHRPCQQDFPSQIALQQHYLKQCPQAVVTCRFKGCGYSAPRHVLEPHEEMCPVGRARCVQCGVLVDQSDLLTHMVAKCKNRVVNCMLCSYSTRLPEMLQHLRGHQEMLLMQQQRQRQQQQQAVATAAQQEQHAANAAQEQAATQQQAAAAARASLPPIGASPGSGGMTVGAALAAVQEVLARTSSRRSDGGLSTAAAAGSSRGSSTSGGILAGVVPGGDRTSAMLQQRRQSDPATTLPRLGSRGVERLPSHGAYHNGDGGQGSAAAAGGSGTAEPSSDDGARFTPPRMRHSDGGALHLQRSAAGPAAASPPMASPWYSASGQRSLAGSSSSLVQGTGSHDGTVPGPATPPPLVVGAVAPNGTRGQAARSHDGAGGEQAGSSLLPPLLEHASPTAMSPSMQARVAYTMMRGPAGAPLSPSRRLLATTVSRRRDLAPSVPAGRAAADAPGGAAGDDLDSDRHTGDPPPPPPQPLASYRRSLSTSSAMMTDCEEMAVAAADGTLEVVAAEGLAAGAQSEHLASLPPLRVSMPGGC